jgi:hypothetical protein
LEHNIDIMEIDEFEEEETFEIVEEVRPIDESD